MPTYGSKPWLGVRDAYLELEKVLEGLMEKCVCHVVISGNPGVGKSWFAVFMLIGCGSQPMWSICALSAAHNLCQPHPSRIGIISLPRAMGLL